VFADEYGNTFVQAVFSVPYDKKNVVKFMKTVAKMHGDGKITDEQMAQAGAIFNLLADKKVTELLLVTESDVSYSGMVNLNDYSTSSNPEELPIVTITQNSALSKLQSSLSSPNVSAFQNGLNTSDWKATLKGNDSQAKSGFFNETGAFNLHLRGALVIDTRQVGGDFTYKSGLNPLSIDKIDGLNAASLQIFESELYKKGQIDRTIEMPVK
jgi:hypothetical protein